jgi:hypothetical protein
MGVKPIDYEVIGYEVEYNRVGEMPTYTESFDNEEVALDFIVKNRHYWTDYRLIQTRQAIIY